MSDVEDSMSYPIRYYTAGLSGLHLWQKATQCIN